MDQLPNKTSVQSGAITAALCAELRTKKFSSTERCIHCDSEQLAPFLCDGVCLSCRKQGRLGRTEVWSVRADHQLFLLFASYALIASFVCLLSWRYL